MSDGVEIYSYHRGDEKTFWFFALMAAQMSVATPVAAVGLDL